MKEKHICIGLIVPQGKQYMAYGPNAKVARAHSILVH